MDDLKKILKKLKDGNITIDEAITSINLFGLDFIEKGATLDSNRHLRGGIPEVVYAERKSPELVLDIVTATMKKKTAILLSRVLEKHLSLLKRELDQSLNLIITGDSEPYTVTVQSKDHERVLSSQKIGILTAGSSDISIAEEAAAIARLMGVDVASFYDVGIAGVHRLFKPLKDLVSQKVKAIVVVAGMEGALPAIVSSLVNIPVIGVPASVGYGYGGKGEAALMTMLQSCSPGLVVVNIDNGINAGATAALIAKQSEE